MPEDVLKRIYHLLENKIGHNPETLHKDVGIRALKERMTATECKDPSSYYNLLLANPKELQEFIELIVVPETWFFRDRFSLDFIVDHCIEKWINHKTPVRILCAPCSTGEEAYSLAMLFHEKNIPTNMFSIDAVDISKKALLDASLAIYGKNSFRGQDNAFRDSYFMPVEGGFLLHPNLRRSVQFIYGNLCDSAFYETLSPYHVILCRNLLIYLNPVFQKGLVHLFKKSLFKQGVLIVSPSESEVARKEGFIPLEHRKYCAFLRPGSLVSPPPLPKTHKIEEEMKLFEEPPSKYGRSATDDEKGKLLLEAQKLADNGEFAHSLDICFEFLERAGPDPKVFFLMGVIEGAMGDDGESEEYFLKTIELEPEHAKALVYLSLLADTKGDKDAATAYMQRAKKAPHKKGD